jgi:hypothetical protein
MAYIGQELLEGACADSVHDFKISREVKKTNTQGVTLGDVVLTLPSNNIGRARTEHEMLQTLLKTPAGVNPIRDIIGKIMESKGRGDVFRLDIDGLEKFSYSIDCVSHEGDNDMRSIKNKVSLKDYDTFFNLKGSPLNIVIDAQSIGIKKIFSFATNPDNNSFVVNSIINREVINDPASKIYDVRKFQAGGNITYNILRENNNENIKYTSFDTPDNTLLRNKFYSKLDLSLSPLLNVKNGGLPRITLDILNKEKELIYQTGNPHLDNAISSCWNLIKKWFTSLTDKHIRCSTFFQCKRSGDWLQALSCIDIDRPYVNDTTNAPVSINNLKLVTLDQILLWYSLFIGIDVIFTCTLPADGTDVEEAEDMDGGEDELEATPGKPKKILMYFTRSSPEDPAAKLARYKAMATEKASIDYTAKIRAYNLIIKSVVNDIEVEINKTYEDILDKIKTAKSLTTSIMSDTKQLLELNWKLTALDYKELVEPAKPGNIDSTTIEELSLYISHCSSIDLVIQSVVTKDDILYRSTAYEINEDYMKLINPFVVLGSAPRAGSGLESPDIRCAKSCSYLKFRLPNVYIEKLAEQLDGIREMVKNKWPKIYTDKFAIVKIISLLKLENMDNISDIIVGYLKAKNTVEQIKAVQNEQLNEAALARAPADADNQAMDATEDASIAQQKKEIQDSYKEIEYDGEVGPLKEEVFQMVLRSGKIAGAFGPSAAAGAAGKPKIKRAMTSGNEEFTEYAQILLALLKQKVGGGPPSKDKAECAYILFLFYLNCLIDSINGYEMMNGSDYIYYDTLARLVISAINVHNGDCSELLDVIYIDLIDADISAIKNKDFKECVQVAAHNVALQSVGLRQGDIPYSGKNYRNSVKHKDAMVEFDKITAKVKGMKFQERKLYIISILQAYIQSLTVTSKSEVALRMVEPSYIYVGGKKTRAVKRKKRNGSPRRKTLRKTRRHK